MTKRIRIAAGSAVLGLVVLLAATSCEEGGLPAQDGTLNLVAVPSNVSINQDRGDTAGSTLLRAELFDTTGLPRKGAPVVFTTSGGVLQSVSNSCVDISANEEEDPTCLRTGESCEVDSECPIVPVVPIDTDASGVATDTLVLRLFQDPEMVEATASSGSVSSTPITVGTNVNTGPEDPRAMLVAQPADRARTGSPVTFDGSDSTFELTSPITCFEFEINTSIPGRLNKVERSTIPNIDRTYGVRNERAGEQDLTITLRVTDDQSVLCGERETIVFSQFQSSIDYEIRCDFPGDLSVNAGGNQSMALDGEESVTVVLDAVAFDANNSDLTYIWNCGNGQEVESENPSVNCVYTASQQQPYQAVVTVRNGCQRLVSDSVLVTITQ